ncbi:kinase-like domain-containing protein [Suillus lakei]|nr:kinase-like domain-containing protein [Suillus lakei]
MHRELKLWLRLSKHKTIVPLLGIAYVDSPLPALVSQWMPSGTLDMYLEKQGSISALAKVKLASLSFTRHICQTLIDFILQVHSENVVHGDLYPANVLVDGLRHPRLTDFGLATVAGDGELQLSMTTAGRSFNPRWRAPEVIGIDPEDTPVRPNFKSDVYSFGGVMFFIVSGDIPWKEKTQQHHIIIELSKKATPARPDNVLDDDWNLIQQCWSWDPAGRPGATEVIRYITLKNVTTFGESGMRKSSSTLRADGQAAKVTPDDNLFDHHWKAIQTLGPPGHPVPTSTKVTFPPVGSLHDIHIFSESDVEERGHHWSYWGGEKFTR